jgi:integrase
MSAYQPIHRNRKGEVVATNPDGTPVRREAWCYKFKLGGEQHWAHGFTTKSQAEDAERAARKAIIAGRVADVKKLLVPASAPRVPVLQEYFDAYSLVPQSARRAAPQVRICNVRRLCDVLDTLGQEAPAVPITALTARLVYDYKLAIERKANAEPEARRLQLYRSAISTLRQARSVFSVDACEYYSQAAKLPVPAEIAAFRQAPTWRGCRKEEYTPPTDDIIAATFTALDDLERTDPNVFKAAWLALGFGLRKGELELARNGWCVLLDGNPYVAGNELAKNHRFPRVRAQLGAWPRLQPHIEGQPPGAFILAGSVTERTDYVFRRLSSLMRSVGWKTQHHLHELRAWAGCQVALKSPKHLYDAQTFLRHANITTTENAYGHHLKRSLDEVALAVPVNAGPSPSFQVIQGGLA